MFLVFIKGYIFKTSLFFNLAVSLISSHLGWIDGCPVPSFKNLFFIFFEYMAFYDFFNMKENWYVQSHGGKLYSISVFHFKKKFYKIDIFVIVWNRRRCD